MKMMIMVMNFTPPLPSLPPSLSLWLPPFWLYLNIFIHKRDKKDEEGGWGWGSWEMTKSQNVGGSPEYEEGTEFRRRE